MREMTEFEINNKHERIRGSDELRYPGHQMQCRQTCGHDHDGYHDHDGHIRYKEHRCFLAIGHSDQFCQFSSECFERGVKPKREAVTLNVDGVAA